MEIDEQSDNEIETINLFDDSTWIEILNNLDAKSLCSLSLTCKRFEQIFRSSSLLNKIKFSVVFPEDAEISAIRKGLITCNLFLTRKYLNLKISRLLDHVLNHDDDMRQVFLSIMSKLSKTVINLEINGSRLMRDDSITLMKPFKNLVELKLENLMFQDDFMPSEIGKENQLNLSLSCENLKFLRLIQCDFFCLILLKNHNKLQTLEVSIPSYNRADVEELENFLLKQTELKELKLVSFRFNSSYSSNRLSQVPFQLTSLYLQDVQWDIEGFCTDFLKSQTKLKTFTLRRFRSWLNPRETNFGWFCDAMKHILIKNQLEKVYIDTSVTMCYIKDDEDFLKDLCNNHVTHLTYARCSTDSSDFFKIFSRIFPNVQTFEFTDSQANDDVSILQYLHTFKNLKEIMLVSKPESLDFLESSSIAENLTSFKFYATNETKTIERLKKLFSKNSKLESLTLEIEPLTIEEITELIINFSATLKSLRIQNLHLNITEAQLFVSNFPKLRYLSSDVWCSPDVLTIFNNAHVSFRLSNGSRF